ncbi:hypothetical protein GGI20_000202 [Coemansia sp. BCRC 34301]|nr:hypothetical protein GGI20_000202 [Coemansia sp. BCRC 34301]
MLGIDHATVTKDAKAAFRQSWSSDEPTSSSTSVSSTKEPSSLWSKLRKQASRLHSSSPTATTPAPLPAAAGFSLASRPRTAPSASHSPSIVPKSSTQHVTIADSNNPSRTWSGIPSPRLLASRRSPVGAFDAPRASTDVLRSSSSPKPSVHSYSMDLPRSTPAHPLSLASSQQQQQQQQQPDATRGMPRLRRLMLLPQGGAGARQPPSRDHSLDLAISALERIVEDDEVSHPASAPVLATARPRAESGTALPPSSRMQPPSHARMPPAMPVSFNSDSMLQVYKQRSDRNRFSENSGETVVSSPETHAATRSSSVRTPAAPVLVPRPQPRLSLSTAQRPTAIYETDAMLLPSPTRENPPRLVPMVHSQVSSADMLLDPTVYRNTFFNARPLTEQHQLEATLISRRPSTSHRLSTASKSLYKSASDDTLNNGSSSKRESTSSSSKVRFSDHSDIIPDRPSDDKPPVVSAPAAVLPPPALAQQQKPLFMSLPSLNTTSDLSPAASLNRRHRHQHHHHHHRLRRPSEPTPSAAVPEPVLEIDVLRRTIRSLQARNDLLGDIVGLDPMTSIPEATKLHIRTLELENIWLRKELQRVQHNNCNSL